MLGLYEVFYAGYLFLRLITAAIGTLKVKL